MADTKKNKKERRKKEPFTVRMKRRGREFLDLGHMLAHEPKKFPSALLGVFRRSFRTIWDARGGGLYACGYLLTFLWLEATMFVGDIVEAESMGAFLGGQLFEMFFRFLGESLGNMILAFIWPVFVVTFAPPWGAVGFGLAYLAFDRVFKAPIERWLFDDDEAPGGIEPASTDVQQQP